MSATYTCRYCGRRFVAPTSVYPFPDDCGCRGRGPQLVPDPDCPHCEGTGKDTHDGAVLFDCVCVS